MPEMIHIVFHRIHGKSVLSHTQHEADTLLICTIGKRNEAAQQDPVAC